MEWVLKRNPRILRVRAIPFEAPLQASSRPWVLVTVDDITRQEALETTRQKFIANASHELKTPVTGIRIAVENLQEGALVLPEGETSLRIILRAVDRMTMLLEDISELSRIETGALRLEPVPLRLGAFVQESLENTRPQAAAANVRRRPGPGRRAGGPDRSRPTPCAWCSCWTTSLSNAIKFSPSGARVTRGGAPGRAVAGLVGGGPGARHLRDRRPADLRALLPGAQRARHPRHRPGPGHRQAPGGAHARARWTCSTELGKGSTFIFRLPGGRNDGLDLYFRGPMDRPLMTPAPGSRIVQLRGRPAALHPA